LKKRKGKERKGKERNLLLSPMIHPHNYILELRRRRRDRKRNPIGP